MSFAKTLFISFQWWTKESILHLINLIISCIMLEGKSKQNKAKQDKTWLQKKPEDKFVLKNSF